MDWFRIKHTLRLYLTFSSVKRAEYIKKHELFYHVGKNCSVMFRKMPLYPKLISLGDNVRIASQVSFVTHDGIHRMINNCVQGEKLIENIGCIDIRDNVFVGSNTTILPGVSIGPNTIIGAGSLVNRCVGTGVYGGVPVKYLCSWEEFLEKRKAIEQIDIKYCRKGGLSEETIEACWKRYLNHNV